MAAVTETTLPGVGVRHEFKTSSGERVAVLSHRSGRREIAVYRADDPDACVTIMHLSPGDTRTLAELLGVSQVNEAVAAVQHELEGLAIDWVTLPAGSPFAGTTIGDGAFRTRTGASVVAVVREATTIPAPGPDFTFAPGDAVVAVGTPAGLAQLRELLGG